MKIFKHQVNLFMFSALVIGIMVLITTTAALANDSLAALGVGGIELRPGSGDLFGLIE